MENPAGQGGASEAPVEGSDPQSAEAPRNNQAFSADSAADLPPPLTAPDCDLRSAEWLPLFGRRLFASDFDAHATDAEFRAALNLWWSAWSQVPAGSLPDDQIVLCKSAGLGRDLRAWDSVRVMALRGFVRCSDGRLYHAILAAEALKAAALLRKSAGRRDADRQRLADWRAAQRSGGLNETRFNGVSSGVSKRVSSCVNSTLQDTTKQNQDLCIDQTEAHADPARKAADKPSKRPLARLAEFDQFWARYPNKVGKFEAQKAWIAALKKADAATILAGLARHQFSDDPQYVPHPKTWLTQGRWTDEPPSATPKPALRPDGRPHRGPNDSELWHATEKRWLTHRESMDQAS